MKKFEYKTYIVIDPNDTEFASILSKSEWELITIVPAWNNYVYWFKREIKNNEEKKTISSID
jgi:hypothetical protein